MVALLFSIEFIIIKYYNICMTTIDQVIAEKIGSWHIGIWPIGNFILCVIALVLSALLCGLIGFERERRGRAAGLRTHILVGLGSCIIMIISIYGLPNIKVGEEYLNRDVARLAAQVITGVGFLGAGAIIHKNDGIRGLTTAATIWMVMAIGLACGSFNFIFGIIGTIIVLLFLTVFKKVEAKITKKSPMIILHSEVGKPILSSILELAKENDCRVEDVVSELSDDSIEFIFKVTNVSASFVIEDFIAKLEAIDGVKDAGLMHPNKI